MNLANMHMAHVFKGWRRRWRLSNRQRAWATGMGLNADCARCLRNFLMRTTGPHRAQKELSDDI